MRTVVENFTQAHAITITILAIILAIILAGFILRKRNGDDASEPGPRRGGGVVSRDFDEPRDPKGGGPAAA